MRASGKVSTLFYLMYFIFGLVPSTDGQYVPRNVIVKPRSHSIKVSWEAPEIAQSLLAYRVGVYTENGDRILNQNWIYVNGNQPGPLQYTLGCLEASSNYWVKVFTSFNNTSLDGESDFVPAKTEAEEGWFSKMAHNLGFVGAGAALMLLVGLVVAFVVCYIRRRMRKRRQMKRLNTALSEANRKQSRKGKSPQTALPSSRDLRKFNESDDYNEYHLSPIASNGNQPRAINRSAANQHSPLIHSSPPSSYKTNDYSSSMPSECAPDRPQMLIPEGKGSNPSEDDDIYENDEMETSTVTAACSKSKATQRKALYLPNTSINISDGDVEDGDGELYENYDFSPRPAVKAAKKPKIVCRVAPQESPIYGNC